jgi:hypothetical protein
LILKNDIISGHLQYKKKIEMKEDLMIDLSNILKPYIRDRLWVALCPDYKSVAGVGKTPKEALEEARSKKIENSILIQAIPDYSSYVT